MRYSDLSILVCAALLTGCSSPAAKTESAANTQEATPVYYKLDPTTAGTIHGSIHYTGPKPARKAVDMSNDPACAQSHKGPVYEQTIVTGPGGKLANAFVYIKSGLEGKKFPAPTTPATIDQKGCWFNPRVLGIQTNQKLEVINSDPVTHNIHPMAHINREWNHSQGAGDPPLSRKFVQPEIMVPVKCNIHGWMHAYIGVVDHPYFAVSGADGAFEIANVPPGEYTLEVWQEALGKQEQKISVAPSAKVTAEFTFKGE